jgi:hypothetical protein
LEIWNAELNSIGKKKPRHFFYTIEYPYPPTNSVHEGGTEARKRFDSRRFVSYAKFPCKSAKN